MSDQKLDAIITPPANLSMPSSTFPLYLFGHEDRHDPQRRLEPGKQGREKCLENWMG